MKIMRNKYSVIIAETAAKMEPEKATEHMRVLYPSISTVIAACQYSDLDLLKCSTGADVKPYKGLILEIGKVNPDVEKYLGVLGYLLEWLKDNGILVKLSELRIPMLTPKICRYVDIEGRNILFYCPKLTGHHREICIYSAINMGSDIYQYDRMGKNFIMHNNIAPYSKFHDMQYFIHGDTFNIMNLLLYSGHYAYLQEIYNIGGEYCCDSIYHYLVNVAIHDPFPLIMNEKHKVEFSKHNVPNRPLYRRQRSSSSPPTKS